jgi:hypothetical protein
MQFALVVLPEIFENLPGTQAQQIVLALSTQNPGSQGLHKVFPISFLYLPAKHQLHPGFFHSVPSLQMH